MRFCKNCKYSYGAGNLSMLTCRHPKNYSYEPDLVEGKLKHVYIYQYCSTQRSLKGWLVAKINRVCGKEGRWYEVKE